MTQALTQDGVNSRIWAICDIMRRSNYPGAMGYIADLTWLLFLRLLDEREQREAVERAAIGIPWSPVLEERYRWSHWAAPGGELREELAAGHYDGPIDFVNYELLPYLRGLHRTPDATAVQRTVSQIVANIDTIGMDGNRNLLDILDLLDGIRVDRSDPGSVFALSQAYEGLLLEMGETNKDAGQFFTPRVVVRAMVQAVAPQFGETVYDPCCGTGGFLAQAYEHMRASLGDDATGPRLEQLATGTFWGREKADLVHSIALGNLVLHGIDQPRIWHGNTLTEIATYAGLYADAPALFDVILTNPPFGGKEGQDVQRRFTHKSRETQVLFLQDVIDSLKPDGRAAMVIDEGSLFKGTRAHLGVRQKLLDECDLWCVVSLATGAFIGAGTGTKTNLLFFTKGRRTERVWYYEIAPPPDAAGAGGSGRQRTFTKRYPLTLDHFEEFFELLPERADSERSWSVSRAEIEERGYDLKAVNPHRAAEADARTPEQLLAEIEEHGRELGDALAGLRGRLGA